MPPAQQVQMQVMNGLAAVRAGIDDQSMSVAELMRAGKVRSYGHQMPQQRRMFFRNVGKRGEMLLRDDEQMRRCLRVNVGKGDALGIFVKELGGDNAGDDLAEEAI